MVGFRLLQRRRNAREFLCRDRPRGLACGRAVAYTGLRSMNQSPTLTRFERLLTNLSWMTPVLLFFGVLGAWLMWTVWSNAYWIHQIIFVLVGGSTLMVLWRPQWFLNLLLLVLL